MATDPTTCGWEVRARREITDEMLDAGWYADSEADLYVYQECGQPVVPDARYPLCPWHLDAMEMDGVEFEQAVEAGHSWSGI